MSSKRCFECPNLLLKLLCAVPSSIYSFFFCQINVGKKILHSVEEHSFELTAKVK